MRKRKVISIVTAVAILIVTSCVTSNAATKYKVGDVNKDGVISINDVTLIQLYLSNDLRTIDLSLADFNGSGSVDIFDCTTMQLYFNQEIRLYGDSCIWIWHQRRLPFMLIKVQLRINFTVICLWLGYYIRSSRDLAFRNNRKLKKVTIPSSYTSLGYYSFADCSNLQYVRIMNSRCHIDSSTFDGCDNLSDWIMG